MRQGGLIATVAGIIVVVLAVLAFSKTAHDTDVTRKDMQEMDAQMDAQMADFDASFERNTAAITGRAPDRQLLADAEARKAAARAKAEPGESSVADMLKSANLDLDPHSLPAPPSGEVRQPSR